MEERQYRCFSSLACNTILLLHLHIPPSYQQIVVDGKEYVAEKTPPPAEPIPTSGGYTTIIIAVSLASVGGILVSIVVIVCLWCTNAYWKKNKKRVKDKSGKKARKLNKMKGSLMPLHTITQVGFTSVHFKL